MRSGRRGSIVAVDDGRGRRRTEEEQVAGVEERSELEFVIWFSLKSETGKLGRFLARSSGAPWTRWSQRNAETTFGRIEGRGQLWGPLAVREVCRHAYMFIWLVKTDGSIQL